MSGLQETFYIMAIIFMSIMFILMIVLIAAVFVIRSKVNALHATIERKLDIVTTLAERGGELSALAGSKVLQGAAKMLKKEKHS